jgi:hypothetical protein
MGGLGAASPLASGVHVRDNRRDRAATVPEPPADIGVAAGREQDRVAARDLAPVESAAGNHLSSTVNHRLSLTVILANHKDR